MAINPHHTIEDLQGVRCSIVERKVSAERAKFIKEILELNRLTVVVVEDPEKTLTVGVTDIKFNLVHALYGRSLKLTSGIVVTPAYWYHQELKEGFYWE